MFQQLVGDKSLKNVVLATTHWNKKDKQHAEREAELKTKHWKRMIYHGSRIERLDGAKKSAIRIIESLMSTTPTVIKIVDELVEQGLSWEDTAVGKSINEAIRLFQAQMKEELDAVTSYMQQLEERRKSEAEEARKATVALEEKYRVASEKSNKDAMAAIADLKQQLIAQEEKRNADLREQERDADREKREYIQRLEDSYLRQRPPGHALNGDVPFTPRPSNSVRLYFRYPSYRLFDWIAWLAWAITIILDIIVWLGVMQGLFRTGDGGSILAGFMAVCVMSLLDYWRTASFARSFFGSCGPETHGLFWYVVEFVKLLAISTASGDAGIIIMVPIVVVGMRYMLTSCPAVF
jgi:hypothetical protein